MYKNDYFEQLSLTVTKLNTFLSV